MAALAAVPALATKFKGKNKDSLRYKTFKKVEDNPGKTALVVGSPVLAEEAGASARAIRDIKAFGKTQKGFNTAKEVSKAYKTLLPAFGTYAGVLGGAALLGAGVGKVYKSRKLKEKGL